ncbi:MAG TPA: bacillithiol biosynthesis BshC, partial [Vicinamibacterales bacterium]|nr:bacillithiol biosynthesis BshC [Vicinamibacterales bacterium]
RDETLRRQFTRTRAQAFPGGHAQERTIGFVSFLHRYGPGLVDHLVGALPVDADAHWVVTV